MLEWGVAATGWTVLIPAKRLDEAKSRLAPLGDGMAMAFLADLLRAVQDARSVIATMVVSADPVVRDFCRDQQVPTLDEEARAGLNAAITTGIRTLPTDTPLAILTADLPCVTAEALDIVLGDVPPQACSFICDAQGIGTTTLLMPAGQRVAPAFGHRSRAAHRALGCNELVGTSPGYVRLRRDVDTPVDLWDAMRIGVGPATAAVLADVTRTGGINWS